MYFQYDTSGTPLGFIYNGTQYLYLTDQMGDVIAITDADGGIIAAYVYDAWGKLLNINYLDEENSEHNKIVNANPLRYRGYYYDNETGYYYLQSRYYDPELCRFISADSFEYIDVDTPMSVNAYAYCENNPINFSDSTGHDFTWDTLFNILKKCLIIDFVFPEFRYKPKITLPKVSTKKNNVSKWVSDEGKVIGVVITEIFTCLDLQAIGKKLGKDFNFSNFEDYLQKKVNFYREAFDKGIVKYWTSVNNSASNAAGWISTIAGIFNKSPKNISMSTTALPYLTFVIDDTSGRYISPFGTAVMLLFDGLINGIIDIGSAIVSGVASPIVGVATSTILNAYVSFLGTREKAEYFAYNWYYLLLIFYNEYILHYPDFIGLKIFRWHNFEMS